MPFRKVYDSAAAAIADLGDGATVLAGGASPHSEPSGLLYALLASGVRELTVVCDFADGDGSESDRMGQLVAAGVITRLIAPAVPGASAETLRQLGASDSLTIETVPRGVLAERLRAAGAGIGGVFVPAASARSDAGATAADHHLETRTINGIECVLLPPLRADFALLRADCADTMGNLAYRGAQRGWNAVMAAAARISIAEADTIGEPGAIDPELVITPGIYVNRIVAANAGVNANAAGRTGSE